MSPARHDRGVPRAKRRVSTSYGGVSREESWPGANEEKAEKLLMRSLKRRAITQGLEIRHSDYGYALIDSGHKHMKDRNDMTLTEIAVALDRVPPP